MHRDTTYMDSEKLALSPTLDIGFQAANAYSAIFLVILINL